MKLLLWFLTFIFILGPVPNTPLGLFLDTIPIVSVVLIVIFAFAQKKYSRNKTISKIRKYIYFPFLYILIVGVPVTMIANINEFSTDIINAVIRPFRIILTFFGGLALVTLYRQYYPVTFFYKICKNIVIMLTINGVIMIMQLYIPTFSNLLKVILYNNISDIHFQVENRVGGLYLSGGAVPSMFQGLALLIIPFLFEKKEINLVTTALYSVIIIISIVITGRSGLVLLPFSVLLYMWNASFVKKIFIFTLLGIFVIVLPDLLLFLQNKVEASGNDMLMFNFNRFIRLTPMESGQSSDGTIDILLSKLSIPDDIWTLLFGNLYFSNYTFTNVSDMGFNISLYKYGIIGYLFYYIPIIYMLKMVFKNKIKMKAEVLFLKVLLVAYFFLEFKEEVIYARNGFSVILLIFLSSTFLYSVVVRNRTLNRSKII